MDDRKLFLPFEPDIRDRIEELQEFAVKDMLSGLLNRAATEHLIRERLENMEQEETCALLLVDLDDFKRVNDTLGHQAGDTAIQQASQILSGLFRGSDIVGRLGGDEFVIFLCGKITEDMVREKAEAICEEVHLVLGDRKLVNLTASVGVYISGKGQIFENMYHSSDLALYKAKKAGKHRYCIKNGETYRGRAEASVRPVNFIQFSELLENMGSGVALLEMSEDPSVIYVSPSFCRIIGEDHRTYKVPKKLKELIHPDDIGHLKTVLQGGIEGGKIIEHTHRVSVNYGAEWFWWHVWAVRIEYDSRYPVMLITTVDISHFKEKEKSQSEKITLLQTALEQTARRVWEVDVATGMFRAYISGSNEIAGGRAMHFPEELIDMGLVHPNSAAMFRAFGKELLGGLARGFGNFSVRMAGDDCYVWATLSYRMLYDKEGRAVRAVGVLEELPRGFGEPGAGAFEYHRLPENLASDLIVRMHADLDLDTVESLWSEGTDISGQSSGRKCSDVIVSEWEKVFRIGDRRDLKQFFDIRYMTEEFRNGRRWLCTEYRRADSSGNVHWVRHVLHMTEDPFTRQVQLFFYLVRLDTDRKIEPYVVGENRRDPVSRLLDRTALGRIAARMFREDENCSRAVAVFRVAGLRDTGEDENIEETGRKELAIALALAMGRNCLLGQYNDDHIVMLFPSVKSAADLRRQLEEGLSFLHSALETEEKYKKLRFITGVSLKTSDAAKYDVMLNQAMQTCFLRMDSASDMVTFAQDAEEAGWLQLTSGDEENQTLVHSIEMSRPLSPGEKDAAIECMAEMLTAKNLNDSLNGVLKTLGHYYRADRVYTMMLTENRSVVVMTFEWTRPSKNSIQHVVSGMSLERFPLLKRCRAERMPVFISRKSVYGPEKEEMKNTWGFMAVPIMRTDEVDGFLCIENAGEHSDEAALAGLLIPFMLKERERFNGESPVEGTIRRLMERPDRQAYSEAVTVMNSENLSSLGAVCIDIPGLNREGEGESGREGKATWYVAKTLTEMFDSSMLFRIWEDEFAAFLPNTTREKFYERYDRLAAAVNRRFPGCVRAGGAWSDGVFTGSGLLRKAKREAKAGGSGLETGLRQMEARVSAALCGSRKSTEKCFTIYFQPKIDMPTGRLVGAEALIRGVSRDGEIIPPSKFIQLLEEDGLIRYLDLMVMEKCLDRIEKWKGKGFGLVPVAVNVSRVTLAHPSTLASILAIQSRHPELPADILDLEITEGSDGMNLEEFKTTIEQYHECGLKLTLDDFGSKYANLLLFAGADFDGVKLDKSLILEVTSNPISRTIVRDIAEICEKYGMGCVAEGIERQEQIDVLLEAGCRCGQGYYYDRPLPEDEFVRKYLEKSTEELKSTEQEENI